MNRNDSLKRKGRKTYALTIRQPWAWLIVAGYKDIENRDWITKLRGRILIHAGAKPVTKAVYDEFLETCRKHKIRNYPKRDGFQLGGIIGSVEIVDCGPISVAGD